MKKWKFLFLLGGIFWVTQLLGATIFLKNGQVLPGRILKMDHREVILLSTGKEGYGKIYLHRKEISRILPDGPFSLGREEASKLEKEEEKKGSNELYFSSPSFPQIDFKKLDRIFMESSQSLHKKSLHRNSKDHLSKTPLREHSFSQGLSLLLPSGWRVRQDGPLVKIGTPAEGMVFFSLPAPSLSLKELIETAIEEHFNLNPSFAVTSKKMNSHRGFGEIEGLGQGKKIFQRFYLKGKRILLITGFSSTSEGETKIREILDAGRFSP